MGKTKDRAAEVDRVGNVNKENIAQPLEQVLR